MNGICTIEGNRVSCVIAIIDSNLHDILIKYNNSIILINKTRLVAQTNLKKKNHIKFVSYE